MRSFFEKKLRIYLNFVEGIFASIFFRMVRSFSDAEKKSKKVRKYGVKILGSAKTESKFVKIGSQKWRQTFKKNR